MSESDREARYDPSDNQGDPRDIIIHRLRAALETAAKALKPFANEALYYDPQEQDGKVLPDDFVTDDGNGIRIGDFRRARAALDEIRKAKG